MSDNSEISAPPSDADASDAAASDAAVSDAAASDAGRAYDLQGKRIAEALNDARRELIDISRRNRLLHTPRTGRRVHCLEFVGVEPDFVFSELARDGKAFSFSAELHPVLTGHRL